MSEDKLDMDEVGSALAGARPVLDGPNAHYALAAIRSSIWGRKVEPAQVGRLELRERLGAGATGVVYAAYDPTLDRVVAVKLVHASEKRQQSQVLEEARALAKLQHPNVVPVYDVTTCNDYVAISMELVEGMHFRAWLAEHKPSWQTITRMISGVGEGLVAAHALGLVHGDVKPENILVGNDGRARIVDFGLASVHGEASGSGGTPQYMAPEQFDGQRASILSDQYSLCVTLYEALVGHRPFAGSTIKTLSDAALVGPSRAELDELSKVPTWLRGAIVKGLAAEPSARFTSLSELLLRLQRGLARPRQIKTLAALTCIAAVFLGAGYAARSGGKEPCSAGATKIAAVWNHNRAAELEHVFTSLAGTGGARIASEISVVLDGYAAKWAIGHRQACEATAVEKEQPESMLQTRMACLYRASARLDALVSLWIAGESSTVVTQAATSLSTLASVDQCADIELMAAFGPLPADPKHRAEYQAISNELERAQALGDMGDEIAGLALAHVVIEKARSQDFVAIEGGGLLLVGAKVPPSEAELGHLENAILQCSKAGDLACVASASMSLLRANVWLEVKIEETVPFARALILQGHSPKVEGQFYLTLSHSAYNDENFTKAAEFAKSAGDAFAQAEGTAADRVLAKSLQVWNYAKLSRLEDARRAADETLALAAEADVYTSLERAKLHMAASYALDALGRRDEQIQELEATLAIYAEIQVNDEFVANPKLATITAYVAGDRFDKAAALLESLDPLRLDDGQRASYLSLLAQTGVQKGDFVMARRAALDGLELDRQRFGELSRQYIASNTLVAHALVIGGEIQAAKERYKQSITLAESLEGAPPATVVGPRQGLGLVLLSEGKWAEAQTLCAHALALGFKGVGPDSTSLYPVRACLAEAQLELGAPAEAIETLKVASELDADGLFALARAHGQLGTASADPQALARSALGKLEGRRGLFYAKRRERISDWLEQTALSAQ